MCILHPEPMGTEIVPLSTHVDRITLTLDRPEVTLYVINALPTP